MGAVGVEVDGQGDDALTPTGPMVMNNWSKTIAEVNQSGGAALADIRGGVKRFDLGQVSMATSWSMQLVQAERPAELMDRQVGSPSHQSAPGCICSGERRGGVNGGSAFLEHGDATQKTPSLVR